MFVVRLEPPAGTIFNKNIFAITKEGEIFWQVVESPHGTEADKPYMEIRRDKDGRLVAANWNGVDYFVDAYTGEVSVKAFDK
ncbi:hypothetical protein D3C71_1902650 [compost metagenome]